MGKFKTITLACLTLLGCSSFNHTEYHISLPNPPETPHPQTETVMIETHDHNRGEENGVLVCPKFEFPKLPSPPELPLQAISKLRPDDQRAMDLLLQGHIAAQHRYITNSSKLLAEAKKKYELDCSRYLRKGK